MEDIPEPRALGQSWFLSGGEFEDCPFRGESKEDSEIRFSWQLGWIRERLNEWDRKVERAGGVLWKYSADGKIIKA